MKDFAGTVAAVVLIFIAVVFSDNNVCASSAVVLAAVTDINVLGVVAAVGAPVMGHVTLSTPFR